MDTNPLRERWRASKAVVNGWIAIPDGFAAETMARQGWDSITVDMQHGVTHYDTAVECLRAITTTDTVPLARVPWNEPGIVMKALDGGAFGVVCPMVSNRAEAERFVGACRYPPEGYRSIGPVRASLYAGADYVAKSAELVVALAMIETREALDNLDAIMSTPGLDGIYIGPNDLCASLGRPPSLDTRDEAAFAQIERILECAKAHGIAAGIHCMATAYAAEMVERGFDLVTIASDARLLASAAKTAVDEMRASPRAGREAPPRPAGDGAAQAGY